MEKTNIPSIAAQPKDQRRNYENNQRYRYLKILKALKKEYQQQNFQFVEILKHYAKEKNGALAIAALEAWDKRISEPNPLSAYWTERHEYKEARELVKALREKEETKKLLSKKKLSKKEEAILAKFLENQHNHQQQTEVLGAPSGSHFVKKSSGG